MRRYRTAISCFIVLILVILSSHFAMAQPDLDGRGIDRNQLAPITPQNIARLEALGTFGVGAPLQMAFSATGEAYAALTTAGLWHDATRGVSFGTPPSQTLPRRLEIPVPPSQSPEIDISPDGQSVVYTVGQSLPSGFIVMDATTNRGGTPQMVDQCSLTDVQFISNTQLLATCLDALHIYNLIDGNPRLSLSLESNQLSNTGQFRPDRATYLLNHALLGIFLWRPATGEVMSMPMGEMEMAVLSRDGQTLATADEQGKVTVWDVVSRRALRAVNLPDTLEAMAFDTQARRLMILTNDGQLRLFEPLTADVTTLGQPRYARNLSVRGLAYDPLMQEFLSVGGSVERWAQEDGTWYGAFSDMGGFTEGFPNALDFSWDGSQLAISTPLNGYKIWEVASGLVNEAPNEGRRDYTIQFARGGYLHVYDDMARFVPDKQSESIVSRSFAQDKIVPSTLTISRDGLLLAGKSTDHRIYVWRASDFKTPLGSYFASAPTFKQQFTVLDFSPDGRYLAESDTQPPITRLWDINRGGIRATLNGLAAARFTPDGGQLVGNLNGQIKVRRIAENITFPIDPGVPAEADIAFNADGSLLAAADEAQFRIWQLDGGKLLFTLPLAQGNYAAQIAWSSDGKLIAVAYFSQNFDTISHTLEVYGVRRE